MGADSEEKLPFSHLPQLEACLQRRTVHVHHLHCEYMDTCDIDFADVPITCVLNNLCYCLLLSILPPICCIEWAVR